MPANREVRIYCDRCRKPVATAISAYGREWDIGGRADGGITPEGQLRGGAYGPEARPPWRSRIWDTSPDRTQDRTWVTGNGESRYKLVCKRRHRGKRGQASLIQRTVTKETLNRVCNSAIAKSGRPVTDPIGAHMVLGVMWAGFMSAEITLADLR